MKAFSRALEMPLSQVEPVDVLKALVTAIHSASHDPSVAVVSEVLLPPCGGECTKVGRVLVVVAGEAGIDKLMSAMNTIADREGRTF